jgi:hypothetical protein
MIVSTLGVARWLIRACFAILIFEMNQKLAFGSNLFSYHPILMTISFWAFIEAIFLFRTKYKSKLVRKYKELIHGFIAIVGLLSGAWGFWYIYQNKVCF